MISLLLLPLYVWTIIFSRVKTKISRPLDQKIFPSSTVQTYCINLNQDISSIFYQYEDKAPFITSFKYRNVGWKWDCTIHCIFVFLEFWHFCICDFFALAFWPCLPLLLQMICPWQVLHFSWQSNWLTICQSNGCTNYHHHLHPLGASNPLFWFI